MTECGLDSTGLRKWPVAGSSDHGNKSSYSLKSGEILIT